MPVPSDQSALPLSGAITDSLELMKKVWSLSGLPAIPTSASLQQFTQALPQALPSMMAPTLDVNELDKRIADLRAVEQWLALNANVLRTTIQSLEVQRNTLAALKSFGSSMLASQHEAKWKKAAAFSPATTAPATPAPATAPAPGGAAPLDAAAAWWSALQEQFAKVTSAALQSAQNTSPTPGSAPAKRATHAAKAAKRTRKPSSPTSR